MQPRFPREDQKWKRHLEQLVQQFDVDIKRLWRRLPHVPQHWVGAPFTGNPGTVEGPLSGSGSTSMATSGLGPSGAFGTGTFGPYATGSEDACPIECVGTNFITTSAPSNGACSDCSVLNGRCLQEVDNCVWESCVFSFCSFSVYFRLTVDSNRLAHLKLINVNTNPSLDAGQSVAEWSLIDFDCAAGGSLNFLTSSGAFCQWDSGGSVITIAPSACSETCTSGTAGTAGTNTGGTNTGGTNTGGTNTGGTNTGGTNTGGTVGSATGACDCAHKLSVTISNNTCSDCNVLLNVTNLELFFFSPTECEYRSDVINICSSTVSVFYRLRNVAGTWRIEVINQAGGATLAQWNSSDYICGSGGTFAYVTESVDYCAWSSATVTVSA